MHKTTVILTSLFAAIGAQAETVVYEIDPNHSSITFAVRHHINKVKGSFGDFSGEIVVDQDDMTKSKAKADIKTKSVNTNNNKRDNHLQQDDYFNIAEYPVMSFETTSWKKDDDDDDYEVTGNLTILGVTKPVTLDVEYLGVQEGQGHYKGLEIIGFEGETEINRADWGLKSGGPIVGDKVDIELSIQGHRKK
ncbi:MAG: YceI family protein [Puniceicoccales bacterium]